MIKGKRLSFAHLEGDIDHSAQTVPPVALK